MSEKYNPEKPLRKPEIDLPDLKDPRATARGLGATAIQGSQRDGAQKLGRTAVRGAQKKK